MLGRLSHEFIRMSMWVGFDAYKLKTTIFLIMCMGLSFFFLSVSLKEIPISIGYGLWTGIGAAGSVLLGIFIFNEPKSIKKLMLVGGIIISIVGLKLVS